MKRSSMVEKEQARQRGLARWEAANNFLSILFEKFFAAHPDSGLIELRFVKKPGYPHSVFLDRLPLTEDFFNKKIKPEIDNGYNVYFGVNPRPLSRKKKEKDIKDVVCLWLDVDSTKYDDKMDEALKKIKSFWLVPNIIVESGHGYHCYWLFDEPIIGRNPEQSSEIKQVLSGLVNVLKADRKALDFSRVLRLPGTLNQKDLNNPKPCRVVEWFDGKRYSLADFDDFKDRSYADPAALGVDVGYTGIRSIVDGDSLETAKEQVTKLDLSDATKAKIIEGKLQTEQGKDTTKSGRDMAIIVAMVAKNYDYETIKSVFFNRHLGCSNRYLEERKPEKQLQYEVSKARQYLRQHGGLPSAKDAISRIRGSKGTLVADRLERTARIIVDDLFQSRRFGFKNPEQGAYYFFDESRKRLMDIQSEDFKCFVKQTYDILDRDYGEVLSRIKTHIWESGKEVQSHRFCFYDAATCVLYLSNNHGRVFRLDGQTPRVIDNGEEGVYFEEKAWRSVVEANPESPGAASYFAKGFDWPRFQQQSLIYKYVIDRASFSSDDGHYLAAEEQRRLFSIYFYSLFFESILKEKPIACFTGVKASGKTFITTAIGQVLFGESFLPSFLNNDIKDYHIKLANNYYVCFDNLDSRVKPEFLDAFCTTATGGSISYRRLYTDIEEIRVTPRVFIALTSREPKFDRDDLVDRLIIFRTEQVTKPKSKTALLEDLQKNFAQIWEELLVNLNQIVRLLKNRKNWNPSCGFRIADWELFGRKVHSKADGTHFASLLAKMNCEKTELSLEGGSLYPLLRRICYEKEEKIIGLSASELYERLVKEESELGLSDFSQECRKPMSLGRRIAGLKRELESEFKVRISRGSGNVTRYSFSAKKTRQNGG